MHQLHIMFNIYLAIIFICGLVIILKLHELKHLIQTFFELSALLHQYIDKLEAQIRSEEDIISARVTKVQDDLLDILEHMKNNPIDKK